MPDPQLRPEYLKAAMHSIDRQSKAIKAPLMAMEIVMAQMMAAMSYVLRHTNEQFCRSLFDQMFDSYRKAEALKQSSAEKQVESLFERIRREQKNG